MLTPADLIERSQWDFFWIPEDATVVDRPEILYVRCSRDWPLLNCVTRTLADTNTLPPLVEEVKRAHAGVTSRWLVREGIGQWCPEEVLQSHGYAPVYHHGAYARESGDVPRVHSTHRFRVEQVKDMAGLQAWYAVADAVFGYSEQHSSDELLRFLDHCTGKRPRVHRFVAYDGELPVSCGGMTSFSSLRFGYLWAGATVAAARGQGAYRAVLQARAAHAKALDLTHVGLYARNDSSAPIVEKQGFRRYGSMSYWDRLVA